MNINVTKLHVHAFKRNNYIARCESAIRVSYTIFEFKSARTRIVFVITAERVKFTNFIEIANVRYKRLVKFVFINNGIHFQRWNRALLILHSKICKSETLKKSVFINSLPPLTDSVENICVERFFTPPVIHALFTAKEVYNIDIAKIGKIKNRFKKKKKSYRAISRA